MNTTPTTIASYRIVVNVRAYDNAVAAYQDFVASGQIWACCIGLFIGYWLKGLV